MSVSALKMSAVILLATSCITAAEEYRIYTDSPRLFLRARRLRLLKRERERDSMRWRKFETLIRGGSPMPEPAFAEALYAAVSGDRDAAARAIEAARKTDDARQIALVMDWLHDSLSPEDAQVLTGKLRQELAKPVSGADIAAVRTRALAAVALSDADPALSEKTLQWVVRDWWRARIAPGLRAGAALVRPPEVFALYELLHAVRDNLNIDLREDAGDWFQNLAGRQLLSYYPAPYPGAENEFHIPAFAGAGKPSLERASMSRIGELEMVAYDVNAQESQFLQGWLMQDRFLLRDAFGAPYEFMWANPYQPGLSYYHFPLIHHDQTTGDLFVRASWDDDAKWFGVVDNEIQLFDNGKITVLDPGKQTAPLQIGKAVIVFTANPAEFANRQPGPATLFVLRLEPGARYQVKLSGQKTRELQADSRGALEVDLPEAAKVELRLKK